MDQQRRYPQQVHAQVTGADDPRFADIGVPGHLHGGGGGGGAAAIPVAAPLNETQRWDQLHTNLLEEGKSPTLVANAKRFLTGGSYKSTYQQILNSTSRARSSRKPSERYQHLQETQRLTAKWHEKNGKDDDRGRALEHLGAGLTAELPHILKGMTDEHSKELDPETSVKLRLETANLHAKIEGHVPENVTERKEFDSGAINIVYSTKYRGEQQQMVSKTAESESEMGVTRGMGIPDDNPEFARRNVATYRGAQAFGMDVIPKTHFTQETDGLGTAMAMAPGKSLLTTKQRIFDKKRDGSNQDLVDLFRPDRLGSQGETIKADEYDRIKNAHLKFHGAAFNGTKDTSKKKVRAVTQKQTVTRAGGIDYRHPTTQKQLLQLQGLDFVTQAGSDRHGGNYFVAPSTRKTVGGSSVHTGGQVKGIDNDASWGTKEPSIAQGSWSQGLPPALHEEDAAKFEQMTSQRLKAALGATVSNEEFSAAIGRLDILKAHIGTLRTGGKLLKQEHFGSALYESLKAEQNKAAPRPGDFGRRPDDAGDNHTSYIGRDGMYMEESAANLLQRTMKHHHLRRKHSAANLLQRSMKHHLRRKKQSPE